MLSEVLFSSGASSVSGTDIGIEEGFYEGEKPQLPKSEQIEKYLPAICFFSRNFRTSRKSRISWNWANRDSIEY